MVATHAPTRPSFPAVRDLRAGLRRWESTAALILIAATFSAVQAATPNVVGIDGYYHAKVAALMWQQGWRLFFPLDFPWLQLTILGPGHYSDHHYLFHVLQAPFTQGDLRVGAKIAATLFGTLGLYTTYLFLARRGVRYPLLWIALLIACAPTFIWRQSMARPQSLFLALLVGAIWAVVSGRPRLLLPLGFLAVWLFDGFPFVLGIPAAAIAAHLAHRLLTLAVRRGWGPGWREGRLDETSTIQPVSESTSPPAGAERHGPAYGLLAGSASAEAANGAPAATVGTALLTTPRAVALGWPTANIDTEGRNRAAGAPSTPDADDLASASAADALAPSDARGLRLAVAALGWALLGIVLGLLLHPYVPRNLEFASLHLLPKVVPSAQLDVPVGQEWNAFSLRGFVTRAGPVAALTALGMVPPMLALARRRAPDWRTIMLGGIAVGFMVMTARSQRLIEYFPALAVLFCAWSWAHPSSTGAADVARLARGIWAWSAARLCRNACLASPGARGEGRWSRLLARMNRAGAPSSPLGAWGGRLAAAWPWLAGAALAPVLLTSITVARRDANNGLAWDTYRDAALWLAANTPAGARVFTTDWDDFPHLFFWNTHNTYLTGLDPTYMYLYDPRLYRRWRDVGAGRVAEPSRVIWQEFGARYVVSDRARKHEAFLRVAAADPGLEEVLRTRTAAVFRVRDARD